MLVIFVIAATLTAALSPAYCPSGKALAIHFEALGSLAAALGRFAEGHFLIQLILEV